jgi:hypothetical protein
VRKVKTVDITLNYEEVVALNEEGIIQDGVFQNIATLCKSYAKFSELKIYVGELFKSS